MDLPGDGVLGISRCERCDRAEGGAIIAVAFERKRGKEKKMEKEESESQSVGKVRFSVERRSSGEREREEIPLLRNEIKLTIFSSFFVYGVCLRRERESIGV